MYPLRKWGYICTVTHHLKVSTPFAQSALPKIIFLRKLLDNGVRVGVTAPFHILLIALRPRYIISVAERGTFRKNCEQIGERSIFYIVL
jgi:hypothetical protein